MSFPINGRVIIVDDKLDQGLPLIKALSKRGIAFKYFTGLSVEELPIVPLKYISIIFLDIILGTEGQSPKNKISKAIAVLRKIKDFSQPSPYILIVWTREKAIIQPLIEGLGSNKPLFWIDLEKYECYNDEGQIDFKIIEAKLEKKLSEIKSQEFFILWENHVLRSSAFVSDIIQNVLDEPSEWDKRVRSIFYNLAAISLGKDIQNKPDEYILKQAFKIFNKLFMDTLESNIERDSSLKPLQCFSDIKKDIDDKTKATINTKLLLSDEVNNRIEPGNIYFLDSNKYSINIFELFERHQHFEFEREVTEKIIYILIETTPICDYVQGKWKKTRLIPGIFIPAQYVGKKPTSKLLKIKTSENIYGSPLLYVKNEIVYLVLDISLYFSLSKSTRVLKKTDYRCRHDFFIDIQSKVVRHINRPGITYLN